MRRSSTLLLQSCIACVIALVASGCAQSSQSTAAPSSLAASTDIKPGGPPTSGAELASIRAATAAFHDVDAAIAAGYGAPTAPCVESPAGAMGIHSVNGSLVDQSTDPLRPEVLLFLPKPGGGVRLVGVEYFTPVLLRYPNGTVGPWFDRTQFWPSTHVVLTPRPNVYGQPFDGPMLGHEPGMPAHFDLHAWVWQPNPTGVFSQFNPAISCANAGQ